MPSTVSLRSRLTDPQPIFAPLVLDALTARLCSEVGFEAGYLSGAALGYSLALSEALLTITELGDASRAITRRSELPLIVDVGVGFGDPVHVVRTVWEAEHAGAAAIEIEDQVAPKRVSHHYGVEHLISPTEMCAKISSAAEARVDPDMVIIARTGACRHEGVGSAIERGRRYVDAGADVLMVLPENKADLAEIRQAVAFPIAVIDAIDRYDLREWESLGVDIVIDPFVGQVVPLEALRKSYVGLMSGRGSGKTPSELMDLYRDLPRAAGLRPLFEIEAVTTESQEGADEKALPSWAATL